MRFVLTDKQVKELQHFLHTTKNKFEYTRALAVLMRHEGMTVKKVALTLHVCIDAVFRWNRRYRKNGRVGLKIRKSSGRPPIVKNNLSAIIPKLLKQDPQAFGYLKGDRLLGI